MCVYNYLSNQHSTFPDRFHIVSSPNYRIMHVHCTSVNLGWQITVAVMEYRVMHVHCTSVNDWLANNSYSDGLENNACMCTALQSMIGWQITVAVMDYRIMHVHCTSVNDWLENNSCRNGLQNNACALHFS